MRETPLTRPRRATARNARVSTSSRRHRCTHAVSRNARALPDRQVRRKKRRKGTGDLRSARSRVWSPCLACHRPDFSRECFGVNAFDAVKTNRMTPDAGRSEGIDLGKPPESGVTVRSSPRVGHSLRSNTLRCCRAFRHYLRRRCAFFGNPWTL
jgi:hypothetical protein